MMKSMGAPAATSGKSAPNSSRYAGEALRRPSTAWRIGSLRKPLPSGGGTTPPWPSSNGSNSGPIVPRVPVKPATSTNSVGGMWACAMRRWFTRGSKEGKRVTPSGSGNE